MAHETGAAAASGIAGLDDVIRGGFPRDRLADNVVLFRYFEAQGWVRRARSVIKKRNGYHERTIRELDMDRKGIAIGEPFEDFQGILAGIPSYVGRKNQLMDKA